MSNYEYQGMEFYKVSESLEYLGELNELRSSDGFGPSLDLAGFHVKKVSEEVPYIGYLRVYPITETIQERHEWLNVPYFNLRQVSGVYRILGSQHIFFIFNEDIQVGGVEESHPLLKALEGQFPLSMNDFDEENVGPLGGAFASDEVFWRWKDSTLFK